MTFPKKKLLFYSLTIEKKKKTKIHIWFLYFKGITFHLNLDPSYIYIYIYLKSPNQIKHMSKKPKTKLKHYKT